MEFSKVWEEWRCCVAHANIYKVYHIIPYNTNNTNNCRVNAAKIVTCIKRPKYFKWLISRYYTIFGKGTHMPPSDSSQSSVITKKKGGAGNDRRGGRKAGVSPLSSFPFPSSFASCNFFPRDHWGESVPTQGLICGSCQGQQIISYLDCNSFLWIQEYNYTCNLKPDPCMFHRYGMDHSRIRQCLAYNEMGVITLASLGREIVHWNAECYINAGCWGCCVLMLSVSELDPASAPGLSHES